MARPPDLLYAVDETPPPAILVASALQHVAVIAITLIFPLILGEESKTLSCSVSRSRVAVDDRNRGSDDIVLH